VEFPIVGGLGLAPGVDLFSAAGLAEYLHGVPDGE
jgi:isocitrate dehydrogenase